MFVLVISVVCTAVISVQAPHWFAVGYMFPVLALYGISAMLMAYCFSVIARSQLGAFAWTAGVQCVMFLLSIMTFAARISHL
jgi:ATP-binding cassette subfamily A (ABC1) protein 3